MVAAVAPVARLWRPGESLQPLRDWVARGAVLGIPTESSYALAADPANAKAVAAIYRLKGRALTKPLPVVAPDLEALAGLGIDVSTPEVEWLAGHWPAPLSGLLPISKPLPAAAGSGQLAVRIPALQSLRQLLRELGHCLTATSANASGQPPLLDPHQLARWLGREEVLVVDGVTLPGGPPSTLVGFEAGRPYRVRQGAFDLAHSASPASAGDRPLAGGLQG